MKTKIINKASLFVNLMIFAILGYFMAGFGLLFIFRLFDLKEKLGYNNFTQIFTILNSGLLILWLIIVPHLVIKKINKKSKIYKIFNDLKISKQQIGYSDWLKWRDVGLAITGIIIYFVLTVILMMAAAKIIPWFDVDQKQDIGMDLNLFMPKVDLILAFLTIVVFVPISEEILFRGYLYGKLKTKFSLVGSMLITSVLFGLAHKAWNVGVDTFALSMVACLAREMSKSIYPGILMHMIKNGLAFYAIMAII